mgnify:CR=1 FL=1|jgi:hypothetical protein
MIVYNITFAIADDLDPEEWLSFIKQQYLNPAVETGYFREYNVLGLLRADHGDAGSTFACQLHTDSIAKIEVFEKEEKNRLDTMLNKKFGERCLSFITVLGKL